MADRTRGRDMATKLDLSYDRQLQAVQRQVLSFAARSWGALSAYRDADADRFIAKVAPRVEAGQKRVAELTDAYISRVSADELGAPIKRGQVAGSTTADLRGVPADEVYRRPFATVYKQLAAGASLSAAVDAGGARLSSLVSTGSQLAKTHAARRSMERSKIETFERVLTGRENCTMCVIASTQRYWRGDLMPCHPGCDCGVRPRRGDPNEQVINPELLDAVHAAVEAQFGSTDRGARFVDGLNPVSDYMDLIATHEHGEIGPVLTWRHQHFTSLSDIEDTP